tara:strand:+ start:343 stop:729 length:387 start_codon:yes stop_codon:yes gene_type:complete
METKFIPTNPEELTGFDSILKEFNTINDSAYVFTDSYMANYDVYVGEESTADGYSIWIINVDNEGPIIGDNVYYYQPSAYDVFNHLGGGWRDDLVVYVEDLMYDIEEYMIGELCTNYDNYLNELEDAK